MVFEGYERPLSSWLNREFYRGEKLDCLTIILKSGGCAWSRCLMCGYRTFRFPPISEEELGLRMRAQLRWIQENYRDSHFDMVKIFTSGSFFDPAEVPPEVRRKAAELFRGKLVIAETRPEYVNRDVLEDFISVIDEGVWDIPLYVAMGLETTDDAIREKSIGKGFDLESYRKAVDRAHSSGAGVKSYLLLKPPFLTEGEAIADMKKSIREASRWSEIVSMNPCTVQSGTEVEQLWRKGAYRPPYLWSILEILIGAEGHLLCDTVGAGTQRGAHNCGECDRELTQAIKDYTLSGERAPLTSAWEKGCRCMVEWEFVKREERPYCMPLTR
ncbi:MAG: archaeosine biosynthesis radical SAM protein RaSEA [Methanomicrobiales archaeon]|nr:archaeosine biosynthesis radical SAM protein RaSEA [Methanomicrobiales archaeon]